MEQLIAGAKFPAKCVKNEIHNLLTTLRLTRGKPGHGPQAQYHEDYLRSFQRLFEELTYIHELHEFDTVAYLGPFLEVIQSDATDAQITACALGAVDKFVSFGLIHPESPRCMEAVNTLAWGVINCRFISSGSANDEVVLLKMVGVMIDCLRCPAGEYLSDACVWHMVRKCFQISRMTRASHLLRASSENVLQQMILTIFGTQKTRAHRVCVKRQAAVAVPGAAAGGAVASAPGAAASGGVERPAALQVYKPYGFRAMHFTLRFLAFLLAYGRSGGPAAAEAKSRNPRPRRPRSRSPSCDRTSPRARRDNSPADGDNSSSDLGLTDAPAATREDLMTDTHCLGLSLLNVALESGGDEIARSDELICVIQDDICKSLLQNSRTDSLSVLSLTLRAIFNLFLHFKRHLKVQLEIFFTSVHLKIVNLDSASYEQREIALESLLEFCREPELMLELYENYDCDVRCTNLFETLVKFLVTNAFPSDPTPGFKGSGANFNSLHRLALSGLLSILHSVALRCGPHRVFREGLPQAGPPQTAAQSAAAETELQRKKEQKRRLALAARTFNGEPSKSLPALQSLGLVSNPPTPESMAEFLRHTPGLDLRLVGEYLSKRHDWNGQVRKAFMDLFPFTGLGLVEALRNLLSTFRLPGEAQLIERLMESFAEAYFVKQPPVMDNAGGGADGGAEGAKPQDPLKTARWVPREKQADEAPEGPGVGGSPQNGGGPEDAAGEAPSRVRMLSSDTIFVLAYSIIMLNTDLHSVKVMKKMTDTEFIRNNRGIDNGKDMPAFFLRDIYEAIRDEEIRLHGDAPAEGEVDSVLDDFFWEGILRRSESIDQFSTTERLLSETPPGGTERDMLQVVMDCALVPTLSLCYESVPDASVAMQAMTGFQDLARTCAYFDQADAANNLVRLMCQYFCKASSWGALTARSQIALRAALQAVVQHVLLFKEAEWRAALDVLLRLWALDLLPPHLAEMDDFTGADGRPLESRCDLRPPFPAPADPKMPDGQAVGHGGAYFGQEAHQVGSPHRADSNSGGDGFLESLTRWFEDETRDDEDIGLERHVSHDEALLGGDLPPGAPVLCQGGPEGGEELPVASSNPAAVHQHVKQYIARSGFLEIFTAGGLSRLPAESVQALAKALVGLARPARWSSPDLRGPSPNGAAPPGQAGHNAFSTAGEEGVGALSSAHGSELMAGWNDTADPVFSLELLTNMTCMPHGPGQTVSQIWPLVSTHFERLLQFVIAGGGVTEQQFIERLIVNTLRLCIRLISQAELVPTLLTLTQHLSKLPPRLFATYSERIACGLLVLLKETNLPHSGLRTIFTLLKRISEFPSSTGACIAGIECMNYWLSDDQELSRLFALQQFPELLTTLKAFASQNSTQASATALGHLSSLVPQLARGARNVPQAQGQWQSLWTPTLQALADIAKEGSQRSSAQAFVYLQRLLLERGTDLSLPWEQIPFSVWKECLEQVLFPLLQAQPSKGEDGQAVADADADAARQASAAQLVCRVVLTHMPDWSRSSPDGFPALFLRLLHILVSEAAGPRSSSREPLVECLKNLLLVISADPLFVELPSPSRGGATLLDGAWEVVVPSLPDLRQEIAFILNPDAGDLGACGAPGNAGEDLGAPLLQ